MRKVGEVVSEADSEIAALWTSSMLEAPRAMRHIVQTAPTDLIDNSMTMGACTLWLTFHWSGEDSYITLREDGCGRFGAEWSDAMRRRAWQS